MSTMVKLISALAIGAGFSAVTVLPAHALSVIAPAYEEQTQAQDAAYNHPPVAFTGSASDAAVGTGYSLSAEEIQHVRWCAQTYSSYHATDNTIETSPGVRNSCKSPY